MKDLPHAADIEREFLGCAIKDPRIIAQFASKFKPSSFHLEKHRLMWQALLALQKSGAGISPHSVIAEIEKAGEFHSTFMDSENYVFDTAENAPCIFDMDYHAGLIANASSLRELISVKEILDKAYKPDADADIIAADVMERIGGIASYSSKAEAIHISESAHRTIDFIEQSQMNGKAPSVMTGLHRLDGITGGLREGELTIIGARPGVGKTSFALGVAINAACLSGNVLMFSLEMTEKQLSARAMGYYSGINLKRTVDAALSAEEISLQKNAKVLLEGVPLRIIYERNLTVQQIFTLARSQTAKTPLSLVIIDHLQIINIKTDGKNYENRNIALGEATRMLKVLSGKLNCPVIALSQLNRDFEKTGAKQPKLSDLRDSGSIEQDADCVMLMHRLTKSIEDRNISDTDIIVAKNRSGPTGEAKLHFDTNTTRFMDLA